MPKTGARRGNLIYHWKHGFIPLDHYAALQKAHHSKTGAVKEMEKRGIPVPKGYRSDHKGISAHEKETRRLQGVTSRAGLEAHGVVKAVPSGADLTKAAEQWKRDNPGKKLAGHEREVNRIAEDIARKKYVYRDQRGNTAAEKAAEDARKKAALSHSRQFSALGLDKPKVVELAPRPTPTHSAGVDPHAVRATQLREAAAKKRAEAERIANSVGAPDRAGAMLRAKDSARMNARMDSGLRRHVEAKRQASALESKAHLADARSEALQQKQEAANLGMTASKLSPGDLIQHKGQAHMVTKVNRTTVSVPSIVGGSWEDKVPVAGIGKHVKVADMKESTLRTLMSRAKGNASLQAVYAAELKRRGLSV